jgi:hypothetical protein
MNQVVAVVYGSLVDHRRESWPGLTGIWPRGHYGGGKLAVSWAKEGGDCGEPHRGLRRTMQCRSEGSDGVEWWQ